MPFVPRSITPIDARPLSPDPCDITFDDSDAEGNSEQCAAKQKRRGQFAQQYLAGQQIFILSAGIKGPFDSGWESPWKKKSAKRMERYFVSETPNVDAGSQRKRRRTDGDTLFANDGTPKTVQQSRMGHRRVTEVQSALGTLRTGAQRPVPTNPSIRANVSVRSRTVKGRKEGPIKAASRSEADTSAGDPHTRDTMSATPNRAWLKMRNTGSIPILSNRSTTPTPEACNPSKSAIAAKTALADITSKLPHACAETAPVAVTATEPRVRTGFTPIDKPNELHFSEQPLTFENVNGPLVSKKPETPVKKKPRLVDFAAMSTPQRRKGVVKSLIDKADENAKDAEAKHSDQADTKSSAILNIVRTPDPEPVPAHGDTIVQAEQHRPDVVPEHNVAAAEPTKAQEAPSVVGLEEPAAVQHSDLRDEEHQVMDHPVNIGAGRLVIKHPFAGGVSKHENETARFRSSTSEDPLLFQSNTGSENTTLDTSGDELSRLTPFGSLGLSCRETASNRQVESQGSETINTQQLIDTVSHISPVTVKKAPRSANTTKRPSFAQSPSEEKRTISFAPGNGTLIFRKSPDMETSPEQSQKDSNSPPLKPAAQEKLSTKSALKSSIAPRSFSSTGSSLAFGTMASGNFFGGTSDSDEELDGYLDHLGDYMQGWDVDTEMKRVMAANKSTSARPENSLRKGILGGS